MQYSDRLFLIMFFGALITLSSFLIYRISSYENTKQSSISAYEEEQRQIYEAKIKGLK